MIPVMSCLTWKLEGLHCSTIRVACACHGPQGDPVGGVLVGGGGDRVAALDLEVLGAGSGVRRLRCEYGEAQDDDRLWECYLNPLVGYIVISSHPA